MRSSEVARVALIAASVLGSTARAEPTSAAADPRTPAWHCGDPIPRGFHRVARDRKQLISTAAIAFGATCAISALVAADSFNNPAVAIGYGTRGALWIPAVGPFLELDHSAATDALLVADAALQVAGLALLTYAFTHPTFTIVPDETQTTPTVSIAPVVGGAFAGAALVGTF